MRNSYIFITLFTNHDFYNLSTVKCNILTWKRRESSISIYIYYHSPPLSASAIAHMGSPPGSHFHPPSRLHFRAVIYSPSRCSTGCTAWRPKVVRSVVVRYVVFPPCAGIGPTTSATSNMGSSGLGQKDQPLNDPTRSPSSEFVRLVFVSKLNVNFLVSIHNLKIK